MSNSRDEWISSRAYALWEQNGREHGQDQDHWQQASREWEELERSALPGHVHDSGRDEGIPPEYLQADTQEEPAPRLGQAPSAKRQSRKDTTILGKSQEDRSKRKSRNSVYEEKDYQAEKIATLASKTMAGPSAGWTAKLSSAPVSATRSHSVMPFTSGRTKAQSLPAFRTTSMQSPGS